MLPFFGLHALLAFLIFVIPKALKVEALAGVDHLGVLLPDLMLIPLAEAVVLGLALALPRRLCSVLGALWGFLLLPIALLALAEHRFFVSTGSLLDLALLNHGVLKLSEIQGLIGAELTPAWAALTVLTFPLGIGMAKRGWKIEKRGELKGLALSLISLLALGGVIYWGGSTNVDPRLISIRSNWLGQMAMDGLRVSRFLNEPVEEDLNLAYPLPEPVILGKVGEGEPPNVVLIILESVRASSTTPYNPALETTPFLDSMAKTGWLVEEAYTTVPHTTKSLVPILCGVPPDIRRPLTETSPGAIPVPCLAQLLEPLGYRSAFFQPATEQFEQRPITIANAGFETFVSREDLNRRKWQSPNYLGVEDRAMLEPILEWTKAKEGQEGPFFLTALTLLTHHDYKVPTTFKKRDFGGETERINDYFNTIKYTDEFLEELVDGLEKQGHLDNTLFVIIGDHGEGHGEHGRMGHDAILYQEGVQVPWLLWGPGVIEEPKVIQGPRQNSDVPATIVDLLGLEVVQGEFSGMSLREDVGDRRLFFSCWYEDRCIGVLDGQDKLIFYYNRYPTERFDVGEDPLERSNKVVYLDPALLEEKVNAAFEWQRDIRSLYATHQQEVSGSYIFFDPPEISTPLSGRFGSKLDALGYDVSGPQRSGQPLVLDLYFEALNSLGWYWKLDLSLLSPRGEEIDLVCSSSEKRYPAYTWVPGRIYRVHMECILPHQSGQGEGDILVRLGGYGKRRMPFVGESADDEERAMRIPITIK